MLNEEQLKTLQPAILGMQIISGALLFGALMACAALFLINSNRQFNSTLGILTGLGILMAAVNFVAALIIPSLMRKSSLNELRKLLTGDQKETEQGTLEAAAASVARFQIVRFALIEGAIFINLLFWFVEGSLYGWVAIAVGFVLMIAFFPYPNRAANSIDELLADAKGVRT